MYTSFWSILFRYFPDSKLRSSTTTEANLYGYSYYVDEVRFISILGYVVYFNDAYYRSKYRFYRALRSYCDKHGYTLVRFDFNNK